MWPFRKTRKEDFETWPIVRSKPVGKTYGQALSLFINNGSCHLVTVDVYEDGSIDCWGFVDRALFEGKLRANWVVGAPKANQGLSVFNFGFTGVSEGEWHQSSHDISVKVNAVIRALNPRMKGLLDMEGTDTEVQGEVRYAKLGLADEKPYRREKPGGRDLLGASVPVLRSVGEDFGLTRVTVYQDGMCRLGLDREVFPVEAIPSLYDSGGICNVAPSGSRIVVPGLGRFRCTSEFGGVSAHDRIGEIHDKLNELNGQPSVISICVRLFESYEADPSPEARVALREAYESVPSHLRCYCGDMDTRDWGIRAVLDGDGEEGEC
jgi:hypothetical protein